MENYYDAGGKLPGLNGGRRSSPTNSCPTDNGRSCSGGTSVTDSCFSVRLMWRANPNFQAHIGYGEAYIYHHGDKMAVYESLNGTADTFCNVDGTSQGNCNGVWPCTLCDRDAGVSFKRRAWQFVRGAWSTFKITVILNTPGKLDGVLEVQHNGVTVIRYDRMSWRKYESVHVESAWMSFWYGGSGTTWAPLTDQYLLLRNVKMRRYDTTGGALSALGALAFGSSKEEPSPKPMSLQPFEGMEHSNVFVEYPDGIID
jgi:hypothetical protein